MKKLSFLALVLLFVATTAYAGTTFWNNGAVNGDTGRCDSNGYSCSSERDWVVYDDFLVPSNIRAITGLTFNDYLQNGTWSDYVGTGWALFNAANPFGTPTYSGFAVFTTALQGDGSMLLSITGFNVPVTPGYWIVGFENDYSGGEVSTRASAAGNGLPGYFQQGFFPVNYWYAIGSGDTAFSVSGRSATPEPGTMIMFGSGIIGLAGVLRRKISL